MSGLVGIDVGGTFTDLIYAADGAAMDTVVKVPSTPDDRLAAAIRAIAADARPGLATAARLTAAVSKLSPRSGSPADRTTLEILLSGEATVLERARLLGQLILAGGWK